MYAIDFIQDLAVIFIAASVAGWVCRRLGLSVVVGYLAAGMLVGPRTVLWSLVVIPNNIVVLGQIGLVFLMFGIGLRLSWRRLRQLGWGMFAATGITALIMYGSSRLLAAAMGWSQTEGLFLAGMLMVSSAVVISKVLHETGITHERTGQLAMGLTMLEDVVAVIMLTLLNTAVALGGVEHAAKVGEAVGRLGAFVALISVAGLLVVPWLLRRLSVSASDELQTLSVAGMLFALALMAYDAGFSVALGAFLLGTIVAETAHRSQVERTFEGMRDLFGALFFTAVGMQIDLRELAGETGLIIGLSVFALAARSLAATVGLLLAGTRPREALQAGLAVTPIGEFSFIIAQLGVSKAMVPERFYSLAVGMSLCTSLTAPVLTRHGEQIVAAAGARQPRWLRSWLWFYFRGMERAARRRRENRLWQLCGKRLMQIGVEVLFVTGLLVFSEQLFAAVEPWIRWNWLFPHAPEFIFWTVLGLLVLAPLVAIWRNCSALALLYAQVTAERRPSEAMLKPAVETGLKALAAVALAIWLGSILPVKGFGKFLLLVSALVAMVALLIWRRKFIYWHSELEIGLKDVLNEGGEKESATSAPWIEPGKEWKLTMVDCVLPDLAECQGKSLQQLGLRARFGCTVMGIERQGFAISLPPPEAILYPRDKVLLVGTPEQVAAGRDFLLRASESAAGPTFEDVRVETLHIPAWSRAEGMTLAEAELTKKFGVQMAGIRRGSVRILSPSADERLLAGDDVLVLGLPGQLRALKGWLEEEREKERSSK